MIVELPNGQELEFPDGTSQEVMRNAIHNNFPEYAAMYQPKNAKSQENPTEQSESQKAHDAAVRYGIKDPLIGLLNFGSRGGTSAGNLAIGLINKLGGNLPKQEATDFSEMLGIPKEKNLSDTLAQFGGEVLPALLAPETEIPWISKALMKLPAWGKYLKTGLGNAITQGTIAASQSPEDQGTASLKAAGIAAPFSALSQATLSGSPTVRNISRALGALGAGGLGYYGAKSVGAPEPAADVAGLLSAALGARGGNTQRRVREDVLKGVKGTPYQESLDAANRLGLNYITPAEASGNPFTGGIQCNLGKTEKGAQLLYEIGKERAKSEENAIENLFSNVFPKALEEQKNALYKSAENIQIPKEQVEKLKDNEIFKTALSHVRRSPIYKEKLRDVPENSIQYLNQVKEALDDMIEKSPKKEAAIIRETKNNLLRTLDTVSPAYKEGRQLAERGIVRREIEDLFNKKDETGTNLFKTLLSNKRDYRELQDRFKRLEVTANSPEQVKSMKNAQQQLEDMRLIFGRLINIPTAKTAEALSRTSMSKSRSSSDEAIRRLKELLSGGRYDKEAVELITNPKWADELKKLNEITNKDKLIAAFHNVIGKAGAQAIAQ
jgi:hypothetical protein